MLSWLIIGGGVHGTHLSHTLTARDGVPRDRLRVLDPHPAPLHRWDRLSGATGMRVMRSPALHHIGLDRFALEAFAEQHSDLAHFEGRYRRPGYALFQAYQHHVSEAHSLHELRICGRACGISRVGAGWRVETERGALDARRVVLAFGRDALNRPAWALGLGERVRHIFDMGFNRTALPPEDHIVVIGGGITAAQVALALPNPVTLLSRHDPRIHPFDSSACWSGAACRRQLGRAPTWDDRRRIVDEARNRGSMPGAVAEEVAAAEHVTHRRGQVAHAQADATGVALTLGDGSTLRAGRVLLATGFSGRRPGGPWLDSAVGGEGLPTAACGYPILDYQLQWAPGLHVSGPLAELELGPVAPNILGARLAAERLAAAASR